MKKSFENHEENRRRNSSVDTLWRDKDGKDFHWKGRAGKGYTKIGDEWKLIMHTGLLNYDQHDID